MKSSTFNYFAGILGLIDVLIVVAELPRQLVYNLLEDDRVNVQPQHVQQEPVPHLRLLDDYVDALFLHQPKPDIKKIRLRKLVLSLIDMKLGLAYPYSGGEDNKDSVENNQNGQKAQEKEPEPEEYVDLLVH